MRVLACDSSLSRMKSETFPCGEFLSPLQPKPVLRVLVAFEDLDLGRRARITLDWMQRRFGEDCEFRINYLHLDSLAVPGLRETAAEEAAEADLILLAVRGGREVAEEIKRWCDRWLSFGARSEAALVVLLDPEPGTDDTAATGPALTYLEGLARRGGMAFIPQILNRPAPGYDFAGPPATSLPLSRRPAVDSATPVGTWQRWGINE